MPKKVKAGKNNKSKHPQEKRTLEEANLNNFQIYGIIEKALGDRFFEVNCLDNKKRRCRVRNKRLKIKSNECVIIALRSYDDNNGDIIYRYDMEEVRQLQKKNILPSDDIIGCIRDNNILEDNEDDGFVFEDI